MGPLISQAFWGAAVSLRDLTVTDYLPPPLEARNTTGEDSDTRTGTPLPYQRALWSMDTCSWWGNQGMGQALNTTPKAACTDPWSSRKFASTDISFERVTFDVNQADQAVTVRFMQRTRFDSCTFAGGQLMVDGPNHDIRIQNSVFLGTSGVGAVFFSTGYTSDVSMINNTQDHLRPLAASSFPGRMLVTQGTGSVERLFFAENTNRQAGPGGLCTQNQGEQILFETGAWSGVCTVRHVSADGLSVTVQWLLPDGINVRTVLESRSRGVGTELWPTSDGDVALDSLG